MGRKRRFIGSGSPLKGGFWRTETKAAFAAGFSWGCKHKVPASRLMPDSMFLTLYRGRCGRKRNRSLCSGYGTLLGPSGTSSDECLFLDLQNIAFTDYGAKTTPHKPHREGRSRDRQTVRSRR